MNSGYFSEDFANDPLSGNCEFTDCLVLVVDGDLTSTHQLSPILDEVANTKKPLLLVAKAFSNEIISLLLINNSLGTIQSAAVRVQGTDFDRASRLRDLAILTGAEVFGTLQSGLLENASLTALGKAEKIVISSDATLIQDAGGDREKISIRLQQIRNQLEKSDSAYEREKLQARIAELVGKKQTITVRTQVTSELEEKMYLMTTAMRSVESAKVWGYVPGGGLALHSAGRYLMSEFITKDSTQLEIEVATAFHDALSAPVLILLRRASLDIDALETAGSDDNLIGFDVQKRKFLNLCDAQIIDSANMVAAAVNVAFYHARTMIQVA